ncbi:MAG: signal recognition particle protein, partial [Planctomycetota bacterium]
MFDRLTERFAAAARSLAGRGRITERNIREAVEQVRTALLEADVAYDVAQAFCDEVVEEALGREVTKSLRPEQEFVGVVHDKLTALMTPPEEAQLAPGVVRVSPPPTIVMLCGLQGSGKTTTAGKLAGLLKKQGRSVMLVAADLQRPAAVEQLETIARRVDEELPGGARVRFYSEPDKVGAYGQRVGVAVDVCRRAVAQARREGVDTVILDTAGRLHVDDALMGELEAVQRAVAPHMILFVVDAMAGQDAVRSARAFHDRLRIDGAILSKFDSDARGGAALTVARVTGAPLLYVG